MSSGHSVDWDIVLDSKRRLLVESQTSLVN